MTRRTRGSSPLTLEQLEDRLAPGSAGSPHSLVDLRKAEEDALLQVMQTLDQTGVNHAAAPASADTGNNAGALPIQSKFEGKSYGQWSAAFWQWEYSMPVDHHPLFDTAPASTNQSGHLWFLGGTFTTTEGPSGEIVAKVTRDATIPSGTALLVPLVNAEFDDIGASGTTPAELRAGVQSLADDILPDSLFLQVDGHSLGNPAAFRAQSPLFTIGPLPDNNIAGAPAGTTANAVADGYQVILAPLSVGKHTLHFGGVAYIPEIPLTFVQDITYNITVTPHSGK